MIVLSKCKKVKISQKFEESETVFFSSDFLFFWSEYLGAWNFDKEHFLRFHILESIVRYVMKSKPTIDGHYPLTLCPTVS